MTEVEVILNENELVIKGETIIVTPYSWKNTIKMAKPLAVVLQAINDNFENLRGLSNETDGKNTLDTVLSILDFINTVNDSDKLINALQELISIGIKRDKSFIEDLDMEELFMAGKAVFNANKDFFTKIMGKMNNALIAEENQATET